ncbi:MAG: hypothetical protein KBA26_12690 [Candidatus Delongbacteria bacterium]|nr:hypothetical protein [Candidatus Delongbacteria bacterium]
MSDFEPVPFNLQYYKKNLRYYDQEELIDTLLKIIDNTVYNQQLQDNFTRLEEIIFSEKNIHRMMTKVIDRMIRGFEVDYAVFAINANSENYRWIGDTERPGIRAVDPAIWLSLKLDDSIRIYPHYHKLFSPFFGEPESLTIQSAMIIPVRLDDDSNLALCLGSQNPDRFPSNLQTGYLSTLALKLGLGIKNLIYQRRLANTVKEKDELAGRLAVQNQELIKLNHLKDEFLSVASHDLRSPLTGIIGLAELIVSDQTLPEKYLNWMKTIIQTGNKQLTFINELLTVLRSQNGKLILKLSRFNLSDLLTVVIEDHQPLWLKKELSVKLLAEDTPCMIRGDWEKLQQVFNNLVYNAVKFSYPKGEIRIVIHPPVSGDCQIEIIDQGMGWEDLDPEKLFNSFTPYGRLGTAGEPSSGLGLSICSNLIQLHGGRISAASRGLNQGAVFTVMLPLDPPVKS